MLLAASYFTLRYCNKFAANPLLYKRTKLYVYTYVCFYSLCIRQEYSVSTPKVAINQQQSPLSSKERISTNCSESESAPRYKGTVGGYFKLSTNSCKRNYRQWREIRLPISQRRDRRTGLDKYRELKRKARRMCRQIKKEAVVCHYEQHLMLADKGTARKFYGKIRFQ